MLPNELSNTLKKQSWQEALSDLITDPHELLSMLDLNPELYDAAFLATQLFPLKVPRSFVMRIEKGNPNDPLLKQILPIGAELTKIKGYDKDPLQEIKSNPIPGLLHKYHGRVLITLTGACAIHCRYCFRRHFPYKENNPGKLGWQRIFDYIKKDETIKEVILSGGDPLSVNDKLLTLFSDQLSNISHVKRLRLHTRIPIVLPERITADFIDWINTLKLNLVIVLHANHPNELNREVQDALELLRNKKINLFNQSVLLKDVNDNANTLIELSELLFSMGVVPYYLHVMDKVEGTAHFDIDQRKASLLHAEISQSLPGYLVPKLVCEEPGAYAKTLLAI